MIKQSATKGYAHIEIEIYHNNKNIDFDSIQEAFSQDIITLQNNEKDILRDIKDEPQEPKQTLRNQIIDIIKNETENLSIEDLFLKVNVNGLSPSVLVSEMQKEVKRLLEDGFIFEPKVNFLRWLG